MTKRIILKRLANGIYQWHARIGFGEIAYGFAVQRENTRSAAIRAAKNALRRWAGQDVEVLDMERLAK